MIHAYLLRTKMNETKLNIPFIETLVEDKITPLIEILGSILFIILVIGIVSYTLYKIRGIGEDERKIKTYPLLYLLFIFIMSSYHNINNF